jgi:hypothetical protein
VKLWPLAVVLAMTAAERPVPAQALHDPLLDRLVGNWVLRGEIAHKAVTHAVTARWVLAHEYVQIREISRSRTAAGEPDYEAIVYIGWDPDLKQYACLWLDSTGGDGLVGWALGHANPEKRELAFVFSDKNGDPSVRNTFAYEPATNSWHWAIDNVDKGKVEHFANVALTRR